MSVEVPWVAMVELVGRSKRRVVVELALLDRVIERIVLVELLLGSLVRRDICLLTTKLRNNTLHVMQDI